MSSHFVSVLAAAGMSLVACMVHAAEPLRLEVAIERALAAHPALAAEAARLRAAEARAAHDSLPPPLVLGAQLEDVAGTGAVSGLDGAQATVQLERTIELGGKRAARRAAGEAGIARQRHELATARLDVATRVRERFIEMAVDQRRLEDARARVAQAQALHAEVAAWVEAARNPESDLHVAAMAVAEAELQLEHAEHELAAARMALAASLGRREPDFDRVVMDLDQLPPVPAFAELAGRLPQAAQLRAAQLEAEAGAARRRLAVAAGRPDITVGVGVRRLEAIDEQALVMSMSMPLGGRRRAAPLVAEAEAHGAALDASRESVLVERHQQLYEMYQELLHARDEVETLRERLLPQAGAALDFSRRAFEAGRLSYMALAQAERTLIDLRARHTDALARYHLGRLAIERLTAGSEESRP